MFFFQALSSGSPSSLLKLPFNFAMLFLENLIKNIHFMLVKEMLYSFIRSPAIFFFSNISNFRIKISGFLVLVPVLKYESLLIYVIF